MDPVELLRLWLEEYEPQMVLIIERHFGTFLSAVPNTHTQYDRVRLRPPGVLPNGVAEAERNAAGGYALGAARESLPRSWVIYDERNTIRVRSENCSYLSPGLRGYFTGVAYISQ